MLLINWLIQLMLYGRSGLSTSDLKARKGRSQTGQSVDSFPVSIAVLERRELLSAFVTVDLTSRSQVQSIELGESGTNRANSADAVFWGLDEATDYAEFCFSRIDVSKS